MPDLRPEDGPPAGPFFRLRRLGPWLTAAVFLLPLAAVVLVFCRQETDFRAAERLAEGQLSRARPAPAAWEVLGEVRLKQGRIAEALPLLERASALERAGRSSARATLSLAEAELEGARSGVPGTGPAAASETLGRAEALAPLLSRGQRAAAWFSAGELELGLGRRERAVADLRRAVALQKDDWTGDGPERRRVAGLAEYYRTQLGFALER